jgi:hypothetical protein
MGRSNQRRTYRRSTEAFRREIVAEYRASGLSQMAFAREKGLSASTLQSWTRKSRGVPPRAGGASLVPVRLRPNAGAALCMAARDGFEIVLGSGRLLRVPSGFDGAEVKALIEILEQSC